jgi:hypothetical protein
MAKKHSSTIENRVYLFKDLASAFLSAHGGLLAAKDPEKRTLALRALADIAHASCVVADTGDLEPGEVGERVATGAPVTSTPR